jgi:hypothetical protein
MKRFTWFLHGFATIALATAVQADSYGRGVAAQAPPVEPSNLFSIPTGRVVRSMDIDLSGTGVVLSENGSRPLIGAVLGLGDIAQLEIGTIGIVSSIDKPGRLADVSSAGLKVFVPMTHYAQGLAVSFRRSGTFSERADFVDHDVKVGEFYTMATVANYPRPEHATEPTAGWSGVKVKAHGGMKYVNGQLDALEEQTASFWRPVLGVEIWKQNARARVVGELNWIASFDREGGQPIEAVRVITGGIRFFFSKHATFDIGVRNQSNYDGLAESAIQAKFNLSLPTHSIRDRIVGN